MTYYESKEGTAIDELPNSFRGIVVIGLSNGKVYMGLRGIYEDRTSFKKYLSAAKWETVPHTKSWLIEMTNTNQKEIFAALASAKSEMNLPDVAIEGVKSNLRSGIVSMFKKLEII